MTFKLTLLWVYFGKSCKTTVFRKPTEVSQNTLTFISIGHPLRNNNSLKIWKTCSFGGSFFKKKKNADIWNFWWIKYLGKGLLYLKNWVTGINYCWNYRPSKLLLHFIEYRLDQHNSKHTKTAVNSAIQYFDGCSQKKCLLKVWRFGPPTTKWRPCKIFCEIERKPTIF